MIRADSDAHEKVEIGRWNAISRRGADNLFQFLDRIEAEGSHTVLEISFSNGFLGLYRVHEALHRIGQRLAHQADLADRCDVIVGDPGFPEDPEEFRRRVRLDCIERAARELLDEVTGSATRCMWTQKRHRLDRTLLGDSGSPPAAGRGGG